jgi:hypothetical protein
LLLFSILLVNVKAQFGQLLMAYYSGTYIVNHYCLVTRNIGIAADTLGAGGVNAIALAFFDPTPLGNSGIS